MGKQPVTGKQSAEPGHSGLEIAAVVISGLSMVMGVSGVILDLLPSTHPAIVKMSGVGLYGGCPVSLIGFILAIACFTRKNRSQKWVNVSVMLAAGYVLAVFGYFAFYFLVGFLG